MEKEVLSKKLLASLTSKIQTIDFEGRVKIIFSKEIMTPD
jgi:hypothetical protein